MKRKDDHLLTVYAYSLLDPRTNGYIQMNSFNNTGSAFVTEISVWPDYAISFPFTVPIVVSVPATFPHLLHSSEEILFLPAEWDLSFPLKSLSRNSVLL